MLKKLSLMTISAVSLLAMHSGEINVNNTDVEIAARIDMGQINENVEPATVFLGVKYLNADKDHSSVNNIEDYYEVNFLMQKEVTDDFKLGLGIKANHTKNFTSLPLGVEASYKLPGETVVPFYVDASFYYAPEVLTADKADRFMEYRVNLDAEVIENGHVVLGYRSIDTDYKRRNVEYNKSVYVGFKFLF